MSRLLPIVNCLAVIALLRYPGIACQEEDLNSGVFDEVESSFPRPSHGNVPGNLRGPLMVRLGLETFAPGIPNVTLLSPRGDKVAEHSIWPSGSAHVRLRQAAVSAQGAICIEGSALSVGGMSAFLAFFETASSQPTVIRLFPLIAAAVTHAPDGTLWAQMTPLGALEKWELPKDFEVLWQFDRKGNVLKKMAPLSSLGLPPGMKRIGPFHNHVNQLGVSARSIALFVPETRELIEFDMNGSMQSRFAFPRFQGTDRFALAHMAMSHGGEIAASLNAFGQGTLLRAFRLDRRTGKWLPVRNEGAGGPSEEIVLGFEGEDLITFSSVENLIYRLRRSPVSPLAAGRTRPAR